MEEKSDVLTALASRCPGAVVETSAALGDATIVIRPDALREVAAELKNGPSDFQTLLDLTCVDYPDRPARFEMVYHFFSLSGMRKLRVKLGLSGDHPSVASLTSLWKNADWMEREVFDLFGVTFDGHPDLRRLFMNEEFVGHPLRKDYPFRKRQPFIPMRTP
jgi:NADH-quinone oxidoreductase subunit C